jgi:hypothetical protein
MATTQNKTRRHRDICEYDYAEYAEADADDYDPFEDTSHVTCYPGAEATYRLPWHDPDMMPIHYAGEKPVYRWTQPRIVEDKERVLVYEPSSAAGSYEPSRRARGAEGERLVGEFPTRSVITLSHYSGGRYFYADSRVCQYEFVFEKSKEAKDICDLFMRIGII